MPYPFVALECRSNRGPQRTAPLKRRLNCTKKHHIPLSVLLALIFIMGAAHISHGASRDNPRLQNILREIKALRIEREYYQDILDQPGSWLSTSPDPADKRLDLPDVAVIAIPRNQYIKMITMGYYKKLILYNRPYNKNELANLIKTAREYSNVLRNELRKKIKSLSRRITKLEIAGRAIIDAAEGQNPAPQRQVGCPGDAWAGRWRVTANVPRYIDQTQGGRDFLNNPGWKQTPGRVGDANPPGGATGIRYMHPVKRHKPAVQEGRFNLSGLRTLRVRASGNCNTNGDFVLKLVIDGQVRGSTTVGCGWRWFNFDISGYNGVHNLKLEVHANGWWYEYAFFDCIVFSR